MQKLSLRFLVRTDKFESALTEQEISYFYLGQEIFQRVSSVSIRLRVTKAETNSLGH